MIRDSLTPYLPQLEYRELARCGHHPWLERHARETFFRIVREWLLAR
jgi:pimeloyl-ACP methyl ester carboxylesterase